MLRGVIFGRRDSEIEVARETGLGADGDREATHQRPILLQVSKRRSGLLQCRAEAAHVPRGLPEPPPWRVAVFGAGPFAQPGAQQALDLRLAGLGVLPRKILPHQLLPGLVKVESGLKPLGEKTSRGVGHTLSLLQCSAATSLGTR